MIPLIGAFQNCSGFSADSYSSLSSNEHAEPPTQVIDSPGSSQSVGREQPQFTSVNDLELWREKTWATKCGPNGEWEVCFEGANIPGYDQPSMFDWDNARDDDWNRAESRVDSWITNLSDSSSTNYMRVDRTIPSYTAFSGHFWRRDEFLRAANGMEAVFRIRILPQSGRFGVMLHFKDDVHQFKIHFATDQISFHPLIGMASAAAAIRAHSNLGMNAFIVRKEAISGKIRIWAKGHELFADTELIPGPVGDLWEPVSGNLGWIAPQIGFGDNNNEFHEGLAGAFDVDYFYYRRALVEPGRAGLRVPVPLPSPDTCQDWRVLRSNQTGAAVDSTLEIGDLIGPLASGRFARSFEVQMRLLDNGKQDRGFSFDYFDKLGGINVTLYPDRIAAKGAGKPGLPTVARVPGFNGLALNRIRFMRGADGLYWHVYVNDSLLPVLVDVRASGFSTRKQEFLFGPFMTKAISELEASDTVASREPTGSMAEVQSIRWCP